MPLPANKAFSVGSYRSVTPPLSLQIPPFLSRTLFLVLSPPRSLVLSAQCLYWREILCGAGGAGDSFHPAASLCKCLDLKRASISPSAGHEHTTRSNSTFKIFLAAFQLTNTLLIFLNNSGQIIGDRGKNARSLIALQGNTAHSRGKPWPWWPQRSHMAFCPADLRPCYGHGTRQGPAPALVFVATLKPCEDTETGSSPPHTHTHPHTHTVCGTSTAGQSARGLTFSIELSRVTGCLPTDGLWGVCVCVCVYVCVCVCVCVMWAGEYQYNKAVVGHNELAQHKHWRQGKVQGHYVAPLGLRILPWCQKYQEMSSMFFLLHSDNTDPTQFSTKSQLRSFTPHFFLQIKKIQKKIYNVFRFEL